MKLKISSIALLLFIVCLAGCARNNVNNDVAYRNKNGVEPTRVDYNNANRPPRTTNVNEPNRRLQEIRNNNGTAATNNNRSSRMRVANKAAKKVTALKDVDAANIIVSNNNAFAAVKLASGAKFTNNLEREISKRVKSADPGIDRVYVSANPDFYNHIRDYANDIRTGKPVSGFFKEFTQTINRVFPDLK